MKTPDSGHWHRTSPFAILFFLGRIVRRITNNAWQSLAPLLAFLVAYQGDLVTKLTLGGIAFVVVLAIASILSYLFFRYQIREDSILIRQGVIKKKQLDIKFERIKRTFVLSQMPEYVREHTANMDPGVIAAR